MLHPKMPKAVKVSAELHEYLCKLKLSKKYKSMDVLLKKELRGYQK